MTTLNEEAREIAQKMVNLEIDRMEISDNMTELKSQLGLLIEKGADTSYELPQGTVFVSSTTKYIVPDGLKQAIDTKVKDASKLNPEIVEKYFNSDLKLSRKALKVLRKSEDVDLAGLVVEEVKESIKVKIG